MFTRGGARSRIPPMRKILIATPLKGDVPPEYFNFLFRLLAQKIPDCKFLYSFIGGTTVQWARDECVAIARAQGCNEILWLDKDLEPTVEQALRLLSHDEPIVCSLYSKRHLNTHWHVHGKQGAPERADDLMQVIKCAIGFSKMKMEAFDSLRSKFPERQYWKHDGGEEPMNLHEYFPMGIVGSNSSEGKLRRIRSAFPKGSIAGSDAEAFGFLASLKEILNDIDYSGNQIRGEDFYFCDMCVEAGVPIYVDSQLIIPHSGEIQFPIPTQQLMTMLKEPWRADEVRALSEQKPSEEIIPT